MSGISTAFCEAYSGRQFVYGSKAALRIALLLASSTAAMPASAQTVTGGQQASPTADAGAQQAQATSNGEASSEDIIVTGVLSRTARRDAAVALTTVDGDFVQRTAPVSAADALKNVPGVFVNSAVGENRNIVYARGLSVGTLAATGGYYLVTLLDDGLPTLGIGGSAYGPDIFYRADLNLKRIEALRGGSATVTGPNAPGGLFNYIAKNALTDHDGGVASLRLGIEGDGAPSQRAEFYYGTKVGESGLAASVGGFYRRSFGSRPTSFPFNRGGQVRASVGWDYGAGSVLLYGRYLNDRNQSYDSERIPSIGFDNPQIAPGLSRTDNFYLGRASTYTIPGSGRIASQRLDPAGLDHVRSINAGMKWEHEFEGFTITNNLRLYQNRLKLNQNNIATFGLDNGNLWSSLGFGAAGLLNRAGLITMTGSSGQLLAQVAAAPGGSLGSYTVLANNLPNQQVLRNGVLAGAGTSISFRERSLIDQLTISKQFGRLTATIGGYLSRADFTRELLPPGSYVAPIMENPYAANVSFADAATGQTYQITNPAGFGAIAVSPIYNRVKNRSTSAFGGATWKATDRLTLDAGVRYERFGYDGLNAFASPNPRARDRAYGGLDGNPLTIYDNLAGTLNRDVPFDKSLSFVNYTGAINYRFSADASAYVRYSKGKKNGDGLWGGFDTLFKAQNQPVIPPEITQYEAGINLRHRGSTLSVTPFLTVLDKVNVIATGTEIDGTTYFTTPAYNKTRVYGVEIEGNIAITNGLSTRAAVTFQNGKALQWFAWNLGQTGRQDDRLESYPNSESENLPKVQGRVGLDYVSGPFDALVNFSYIGGRPSSFTGVTRFPGYSQTDVALSYSLTPAFRLTANVNNVFNTIGIFNIQNPNLPISGVSQADLQRLYPNATTGILTTQPRAYFLTGLVNF